VPLILPFHDSMSCQKSAKNPMQKLPKNLAKICYAKIQQKSFMISLTKNLQKTLKDIQKLPNFTKQL